MKKLLILALFCLSINICLAQEEEIKLDLSGETVEQEITVPQIDEKDLKPINDDQMQNNGIMLQNTVTPVNGVRYNSTPIIPAVGGAMMPMLGVPTNP